MKPKQIIPIRQQLQIIVIVVYKQCFIPENYNSDFPFTFYQYDFNRNLHEAVGQQLAVNVIV